VLPRTLAVAGSRGSRGSRAFIEVGKQGGSPASIAVRVLRVDLGALPPLIVRRQPRQSCQPGARSAGGESRRI
jgi:hypothetical protein